MPRSNPPRQKIQPAQSTPRASSSVGGTAAARWPVPILQQLFIALPMDRTLLAGRPWAMALPPCGQKVSSAARFAVSRAASRRIGVPDRRKSHVHSHIQTPCSIRRLDVPEPSPPTTLTRTQPYLQTGRFGPSPPGTLGPEAASFPPNRRFTPSLLGTGWVVQLQASLTEVQRLVSIGSSPVATAGTRRTPPLLQLGSTAP